MTGVRASGLRGVRLRLTITGGIPALAAGGLYRRGFPEFVAIGSFLRWYAWLPLPLLRWHPRFVANSCLALPLVQCPFPSHRCAVTLIGAVINVSQKIFHIAGGYPGGMEKPSMKWRQAWRYVNISP